MASQSSSQSSQPSSQSEKREKFRELFHASYSEWKRDKKNLGIKSDDTYAAIIEAFRKKNYNEELSTNERNWIKRYQCIRKDGVEMVQHNEKFVVKESNLFDLLYDVHVDKGHCGRDLLFYELRKDFDGISKEVLSIFVKCCVTCELNRGKVKRGVVVKPILSDDQNSRCQVDLIDYQAKPDGEYRFVMVYQDHLTKFVILKPLKNKTGDAVAEMLIEIFSTFDAPKLLKKKKQKKEDKATFIVTAKEDVKIKSANVEKKIAYVIPVVTIVLLVLTNNSFSLFCLFKMFFY